MQNRNDHRPLIAYLVMVGVGLSLFIAGNVAWQHWYCGTPLTECRAFASVPCEPIIGIEAEQKKFIDEHPLEHIK